MRVHDFGFFDKILRTVLVSCGCKLRRSRRREWRRTSCRRSSRSLGGTCCAACTGPSRLREQHSARSTMHGSVALGPVLYIHTCRSCCRPARRHESWRHDLVGRACALLLLPRTKSFRRTLQRLGVDVASSDRLFEHLAEGPSVAQAVPSAASSLAAPAFDPSDRCPRPQVTPRSATSNSRKPSACLCRRRRWAWRLRQPRRCRRELLLP